MSNEQQPLLSVIVTSYNNCKYLSQSLDSVLSQNSGYSYEIVVGDDCSTDGARELLIEYRDKYPDIIRLIFNEKNMGAMANYFNVLSNCRGKYLALCADDDFWLPGKVKRQVDFLESNPDVGMVYGQVVARFEDSGHMRGRKEGDRFGGPAQTFEELMERPVVPAVSVMWRRELSLKYIDEVNPLSRGWLTEDYPMWLWFTLNSRIVFMNEANSVNRIWTGSVSHPKRLRQKMAFSYTIDDIKMYFAERYYDEIPLKIEQDHLYHLLKLRLVEHDWERVAALKPKVKELRKRRRNSVTRKMMSAVKMPRLFVFAHGYGRR